jgi:hypothetical protein
MKMNKTALLSSVLEVANENLPFSMKNMMWTDYHNTCRYCLDETLCVEKTGQWRTGRQFLVNEPLSRLKEKLVR